jgi:tetratricopeptide (TPR) repeat protein
VLGTYEAERGEIDKAVLHLQQAHELSPQLYAVANNLAWVLSETTPPQLDRALALINAALEIHPDMPEMLDTRGQILTKKGEWRAALRDLEAALPTLKGDKRLHEALAECYRKLGSAELAEQHAVIATRLASQEKE